SHYADHAEAAARYVYAAAERTFVTEEFVPDLGTQRHERTRAGRIIRWKETAHRHVDVQGLVEVRAHAIHRDPAAAPVGIDLRISLQGRVGVKDLRNPPDGFGVFDGERTVAAENTDGPAARGGLSGGNANDVGAELGEFREDELVDALAD